MKFEWKIIDGSTSEHVTYRAKTVGGWLVRVDLGNERITVTSSVTFVPDKNHIWKVDE